MASRSRGKTSSFVLTLDVKSRSIYLGRMKVETIERRGGVGGFLFGRIGDVDVTWDSSLENLDFVREKIPELKDVEIIHVPITIEPKGYSLFVHKEE